PIHMAITIEVRGGHASGDEPGRQRVAEGKARQRWITGRLRSHKTSRQRRARVCGINSLVRVRPVEVLQVFWAKTRGQLPPQEANWLIRTELIHSRQRLDPWLHHEDGLSSNARSDGKIHRIGRAARSEEHTSELQSLAY